MGLPTRRKNTMAQKIGILGFAREGRSTLKFLKESPQYKDAEFWIVDKKATIKIPRGIHGQLGKNYLRILSRFDLIFRSPGIPWNTPELVRARRAGVQFSSATKLFFEQFESRVKGQGSRAIGKRGRKGKGPPTPLLYQILKAAYSTGSGQAHKPVFLAGNIGTPALDILPRLRKSASGQRESALVILELSSFQLQDLTVSPHIAAVLDVFPDHQDAHKNLAEYYDAKTNIARYQKKNDAVFFLKNNPVSARIAKYGVGKKIAVDPAKNNALLRGVNLKIPGEHNFKNAVMAATIARHLGVPRSIIVKTVKNFRGLEHRLEFVRKIRDPKLPIHPNLQKYSVPADKFVVSDRFIEFWNDSASTNPQTTAAAIKAFSVKRQGSSIKSSMTHDPCRMSLVLIAGGQDKGLDYAPLARALRGSNTKLVVLFGENKKKIAHAINGVKRHGSGVKMVKNLKQAVHAARAFAKSFVISHKLSVIVLFSPGAASFDQFHDYANRGRIFKNLINKLT